MNENATQPNEKKKKSKKPKGHLTTWMKVAAAVAVCRDKPAGLTARQFTEKLRSNFIQNQIELRADYEKTKDQLLNLKLQVSDDRIDNQVHIKGPSLVNLTTSNIEVTTPPSSHEVANRKVSISNSSKAKIVPTLIEASAHHQSSKLIQSISKLNNFLMSGTTMQDCFAAKEAVICIKTISDVIACETLAISDSIPDTILKQTASVTCQFLEYYPNLSDNHEFMEAMFSITESVLLKVKSPSLPFQYPPHRGKLSYSSMLVVFLVQAPATLCAIVVESVVEALDQACQHLIESQKAEQAPDVDVYDNCFFLTDCLLQAVDHWCRSCCLHPQVLNDMQGKLEESILCLSEHFPLVSQHVWKVTTYVEAILQNLV